MRKLTITASITSREPVLDKYFREIDKVALISPDEEVLLMESIKKGSKAAVDRLTRANLRFVVSVAKKYQGQGLSLPDLINEGNVGLIEAARHFDPSRGFRFISFAVWHIRQRILKALADHARMIRLPFNKVALSYRIQRAACLLEQKLERLPTAQELAEELNIDLEEVNRSLAQKNNHVSLDMPISEDEETGSLLDVLENPDKDGTEDDLYHKASLKTEIARLFRELTDKQKEVICNFFGIGMDHPLSLDEIARRMDLTTERVRQIKDKAIEKMRTHRSVNLLRGFLAA